MRHYFIDLENVRSAGLEGIVSLGESDYVHIFYSDNANSLTIPALESINSSKARVSFTKINATGSNAMDFQIVAMMGAMIEREKTGEFYVISHDNGFRSAINFCRNFFSDYAVTVGQAVSIAGTQPKKTVVEEAVPKEEVKPQSDAKRRSSRSKKTKEKQAADEAPSESEVSGDSTAADDSDPYGYIYDILSNKLSKNVLDVYAEGIHEGIVNSSTRREYKKFLYEKYGDEEGEALYNLVQLYFEKMKKSIS